MVVNIGKDALLPFEHHLREKAPFSAEFMDIGMPDMNGHAVVECMHEIERGIGISPIKAFKLIMLTNPKAIAVSKAFFKNEADAYIHKEGFDRKLNKELHNLDLAKGAPSSVT